MDYCSGDEDYQDDGSVLITISIDSDREDEFTQLVLDLTCGMVSPTKL